MRTYDTLSEAIADLKKRGYSRDFNLALHQPADGPDIQPAREEKFTVEEVYRFEGMSDPDDNSVLFAITSTDGVKGTLLDAYGVYTESLTPEMMLKLKLTRDAGL